MNSNLVNQKITKEKLISIEKYLEIDSINEFILYADNILEGISLLNDLTINDNILIFYKVVYEPIDQPIYLFTDEQKKFYSIKICGAYDKWELPSEVSKLINYIDLPDYVLYSIRERKVILAGENTETASVGNSQWQREGRKLGAARLGVPFIYQTFYSGRDESQDTIREPSSLQVYNHLIYSARYKTASFVAYFDNNFENSQTRFRSPVDSKEIYTGYIKSVIYTFVNPDKIDLKKKYEKLFFLHMLEYIKEPKFIDLNKTNKLPRIIKDLPSINQEVFKNIVENSSSFVENLIKYIYSLDKNEIEKFLASDKLLNFNSEKFEYWSSYSTKKYIKNIFDFFTLKGYLPKTYIKGSAKIGFVKTDLSNSYLINKFHTHSRTINLILDSKKFPESILLPLRIHKLSNGRLVFSPDPESGEIVSFAELFSKNLRDQKIRPVIGYCIVDTPSDFDILTKKGTKLYKAIAEYVDILILDDYKIFFSLPNSASYSNHIPSNIVSTNPISKTEEVAVVSTYLNQSTIQSNWELCFIHTHHSSWQQLVIHYSGSEVQEKIDRISTKVDLIMQLDNKFMISEGKNTFQGILSDQKIQNAIILTSKKIDFLYKSENIKFDAFVYNLQTTPTKNPQFYLGREAETVHESIKMGHFDDIAYNQSYVVIIVYLDEKSKTKFRLVYSKNFDTNLKIQLDKEFCQ